MSTPSPTADPRRSAGSSASGAPHAGGGRGPSGEPNTGRGRGPSGTPGAGGDRGPSGTPGAGGGRGPSGASTPGGHRPASGAPDASGGRGPSAAPTPGGGSGPSASVGSPSSPTPDRTATAADFYAVNRGGGLFSEAVSQRIGARIAVGAYRRRLAPSVLTVVNLGLGCLVSFVVVAAAGPIADGRIWAWPVGLLALIGWQLAYAFDCADGQLARVTGQTSAAGGRLDVLCDVAVQISLVAAVAAIAKTQVDDTPAWLLAAFAGTWMINLVTSVMQSGAQAASMVTSRSLPVRVVKLVRDYGAVIALAGAVLTVAPQWTVWFVGLFTLVNAGFLAASVVFSAREALHP